MLKNIYRNFLLFLASPCQISLVWIPWVICLLGFFACIVLFYPGSYSTDAITQYFQVEWGLYTDWHPPVMAVTWKFLRELYQKTTGVSIPGDGLLFVLYLSFFWGGLLLVLLSAKKFWRNTDALVKPWYLVVLTVSLLGLACVEFFDELRWISKDVGMMGAYMIAIGCLLNWPTKKTWQWFSGFSVLFFLFYGTAIRHNAIFALFPLVFWLVWQIFPTKKTFHVVCESGLLWGMILVAIHYTNYHILHAVRLYPLQERFYADIFQLNARTKDFVLPPDTFRHCFDELDKTSFRNGFLEHYVFINQAFQKISVALPQYDDFTQNFIIYPSTMNIELTDADNQLRDFRKARVEMKNVVDEASVRNCEKDYLVLRDAWIKRICLNPKDYLAYRVKEFVKFCIGSGFRLLGINSMLLLILLSLTLIPPLCHLCRMANSLSLPRVALGASAWLYIMPYLIFLTDNRNRYVYWFLVASVVSLVMFCHESPLIRSLIKKITDAWETKLRDIANSLE